MSTKENSKEGRLAAVETALKDLQKYIVKLDDQSINTIPYAGSWTAAQVLDHITKSINGLAESLGQLSKPAERNPEARIPELEMVFLDFSHKMKSPDFIIPDNGPFKKQEVLNNLDSAFHVLKEKAKDAHIEDLVVGLPLGPITKAEILHFLKIHAVRHTNQMQRITEALDK